MKSGIQPEVWSNGLDPYRHQPQVWFPARVSTGSHPGPLLPLLQVLGHLLAFLDTRKPFGIQLVSRGDPDDQQRS